MTADTRDYIAETVGEAFGIIAETGRWEGLYRRDADGGGRQPMAAKNRLPEPSAASVRVMAHEAAARDEAVDELLEAEAEGLWEDGVEGAPGASKSKSAAAAAAAKGGANPFGVRELTVLEKRYQAEAQSRQKANQIVKQVVGGKEWVGPPFLAKPAVLLFKDFTVGETCVPSPTATSHASPRADSGLSSHRL